MTFRTDDVAAAEAYIAELGWKVDFDGHHQFEEVSASSDPPIGILKNPRLVSRVSQAVANSVGAHARQGQLPVTIGGDHSLVRLSTFSPPEFPDPSGQARRGYSLSRSRA